MTHERSRRRWSVTAALASAAMVLAEPPLAAAFDGAPPRLLGVSLDPSTIDTTGVSAQVKLLLEIHDPGSGFVEGTVQLRSPRGQTMNAKLDARTLTSGDDQAGVHETTFTFPPYAEGGRWVISRITARDHAGNDARWDGRDFPKLQFPNEIHVTPSHDEEPPELTELRISPRVAAGRQGASAVRFHLGLKDQFSFESVTIRARSPSGEQTIECTLARPQRVRGDAQLGEYAGSVELPVQPEQGTWEIVSVKARDDAGNESEWDDAMLARAGFPIAFLVKARRPL